MKPNSKGYFGKFGGRFVSNYLSNELDKLNYFYKKHFSKKINIKRTYNNLTNISCRPTPLYYAKNLSKKIKNKVFFKREDLNFTGSHKINNVIGQMEIAKILNKKIIISETGAGQHGVAVSSICAKFNTNCLIFMGENDCKKQISNYKKIKILGSKIIKVNSGNKSLKEAINEAIRFWINNKNTYYLIGSVVGPHPYPEIVRNFQKVIGKECYFQLSKNKINLDYIISCIGGGSNGIGIFKEFINSGINLIGVEAGGSNLGNSASIKNGSIGTIHGCKTYVIKDKNGKLIDARSISSGLRYPSIGPEHAYLSYKNLVKYKSVSDKEVIKAFKITSKLEGIIPSLESSHAIAYAIKLSKKITNNKILINLSGRGDKDVKIFKK
ncbi:tryptophan synthase subunit beta [Candidatus Vidania fulgoroideorum]